MYLHGRPVSMAAEDGHRLVQAVDLAAEAAAHRAADEVQPVRTDTSSSFAAVPSEKNSAWVEV